jgi:hypothetical protein
VTTDKALLAAFCSAQAWSLKISSILLSTSLAQRGSVGNFNLNMNAFLEGQKYPFLPYFPKVFCLLMQNMLNL